MIILRSLIFNVLFYSLLGLFLVLGSFNFLLPRRYAMRTLKFWSSTFVRLLAFVCGTRFEVRGREHLPKGAAIVAGKHQSFFETFAILPLLDDPCVVLKKELTYIPFLGWFAFKSRMIAVERSAGSAALRKLIARAKEEIASNRQIFIMPEGTRAAPDAAPVYKPGAAALYGALGVPCVPFGLNSGLFWPRRSFLRLPGTITIEFLPAIPPSLPRKQFERRLQADIENATNRLVAEGRQLAQSRNDSRQTKL